MAKYTFRKYVVNSNTGICKKSQQNEEKNIQSDHMTSRFQWKINIADDKEGY
jgi:hypothetical protein